MTEQEKLIMEQARLLDEDMKRIKAEYSGRYIAYYNHKVLATGNTAEQTFSRIPNDKRSLPCVVRLIGKHQTEIYMGGPKS